MFRKIVSIIISLSLFSSVAFPPEAMASIGLGGISNDSFSIETNIVNENVVGTVSGGNYVLTSGLGSIIEYEVSDLVVAAAEVEKDILISNIGQAAAGRLTSPVYTVESGLGGCLAPVKPIQLPDQYIPSQILEASQNGITKFDLDDYFVSPLGYALSYSVSQTTDLLVTINAQNIVSFSWPNGYTGTNEITFIVTDVYGSSVRSNPVTIQVVDNISTNPLIEMLEKFLEGVEFTPDVEAIIEAEATNENGEVINFSFTAVLDQNGNWHFDYMGGQNFNMYTLLYVLSKQLNLKFNFYLPETLLPMYLAKGDFKGFVSTNQNGGLASSNANYSVEHSAIAQPLSDLISNTDYQVSAGVVPVFTYMDLGNSPLVSNEDIVSGGKSIVAETIVGQQEHNLFLLKSGLAYGVNSLMPYQISNKEIKDIYITNLAEGTNTIDLDDYFKSPANSSLTYTILGADLIGASLDSNNLLSFSWTDQWQGYEYMKVLVTDGYGNKIKSNEFKVAVANPRNPPVLDFIPNIAAFEGELVAIVPKASDADGELISYEFSKPFDKYGIWQPDYSSAGEYDVVVSAVDQSGLKDSQLVRVAISNVNRAPYFTNNNEYIINVNEGDVIDIRPEVLDPDGNPVVISYSNYLDINGRWATGYSDAGQYTLTVTASDGIDDVSAVYTINIANVNRAPELSISLDKYTVEVNQTVNITVNASDPDGDSLELLLKDQTGTVIYDGPITDTYTTAKSYASNGDYTFTAIVYDNSDRLNALSSETSIGLDVTSQSDKAVSLMGDFNGDSLMDLGVYDKAAKTWEIALSNQGEIQNATLWLSGLGDTDQVFRAVSGDFNGDGKTDVGLYDTKNGELKVATSNGSSFNSAQLIFDVEHVDNDSNNWYASFIDANGDGFTDILVYDWDDGRIKVSLNNKSMGFGTFEAWQTVHKKRVVFPGDYNGDGLTDLALQDPDVGSFDVALSTGRSFVSETRWISSFTKDTDKVILADFNSDGMADLGEWDENTGIWKYVLSTGSSFDTSEVQWQTNFGNIDHDSASTGDFNGDGLADAALFKEDGLGILCWDVKLSEGEPSDLLIEINNNSGAKTEIDYQFCDKVDNIYLPFPVLVTSKVTHTDLIGDTPESYSTEFQYFNGYFDAQEKEFRGFEKVKTKDPITGNYTQTKFWLGQDGEDGALKGQLKETVSYDGNDRLISETFNTYQVFAYGPANGLGFPALVSQRSNVYEVDGSSLSTEIIYHYDSVGNAYKTDHMGLVDINGENIPNDERCAHTEFYPPYVYDDLLEGGFNAAKTQRTFGEYIASDFTRQLTKVDYTYDTKGNVLTQKNFLNTQIGQPITNFTYDIYGNVLSQTDPMGALTTTVYDQYAMYPASVSQKISDQLTLTSTMVYDQRFGLELSVTDANGNTNSKTYDSLGRPLTQVDAYGRLVSSTTYPDFNTTIVDTNSIISTEYKDGLGRVYKTTKTAEDASKYDGSNLVVTEKFYNNRGLLERESMPHYADEDWSTTGYVKYEYDLRGRVVKTTNDYPGLSYDTESNVFYITPLYTEATNAKGTKKAVRKDVYGNVVETIDFAQNGQINSYYEYDGADRLIKLTDDQGNVSTMEYDTLGRKSLMNDVDMGTWRYDYDLAGRLVRQVDAKNQYIEFDYDLTGRLISKRSIVNGVEKTLVLNEYDDVTKTNALGKLTKSTDHVSAFETVVNTFDYDKLGRAVSNVQTVDGVNYQTDTSYDIMGRVESIEYPLMAGELNREIVNYTYDPNSGELETVEGNQSYLSAMEYNAQNKLMRKVVGNNIETDYTYHPDYRLSAINTISASSNALQRLSYTFDKNGNVTRYNDLVGAVVIDYQYDNLDRLTRATNVPLEHGLLTYTYQYDSIGNMTFKSDVGMMYYGEGAGPHAVTSTAGYLFEYDQNGNMTKGRDTIMEYDAQNRLVKLIKDSITTDYQYLDSGHRLRKLETNATETISTTYIGNLLELDSDGKARKHIYAASDLIATVESTGDTKYYHKDHLGSTDIVTDADGNIIVNYEYQPYGQPSRITGTDSVAHKFTGQRFDANSDLYYYNARYYDAVLGRFVQADTIVPDPMNSQALNRYSYCLNNPVKYVDPTGHSSQSYGWDYSGFDSSNWGYTGSDTSSTWTNDYSSFDSGYDYSWNSSSSSSWGGSSSSGGSSYSWNHSDWGMDYGSSGGYSYNSYSSESVGSPVGGDGLYSNYSSNMNYISQPSQRTKLYSKIVWDYSTGQTVKSWMEESVDHDGFWKAQFYKLFNAAGNTVFPVSERLGPDADSVYMYDVKIYEMREVSLCIDYYVQNVYGYNGKITMNNDFLFSTPTGKTTTECYNQYVIERDVR